MPRRRKNSTVQIDDDSDIEIGDVVREIYPEGVPTNEDGSLASETEISSDQAKKIGAVNAESAQYNKSIAKKMHNRQKGAPNVRWGETDALQLYNIIKGQYPSSMIHVYVSRVEPPVHHRPFLMTSVKNAEEFYSYITSNFHKTNPAAGNYLVRFVEGSMERGRGYLQLPDMTAEFQQASHMQPMQQQGFPGLPGVMPIPPMFFHPPYGGAPQYPYGGYPPQAPPAPPAPPAAVAPPAAAPTAQASNPAQEFYDRYHGQQPSVPALSVQPPAPQQPSQDPIMLGVMQSMFQDFQRMQQMLHQNQLQLEKTLGQVEEMRRHGADHRANQPQPLNIPMYQGVAAPSPMAPPPAPVVPATFQGMNPQDFQTLMAFIQQQNGSTNPFGVGASPQPPPQQFQPQQQVQQPQQQQYPQQQMVPQQANSLDQIKQMVETMTGMSKAMADIRRAVAPEEEEVGPAPFVPDATGAMVPAQQQQAQEEGPFKTMPLGFGKDPAMLAYNPDGSVHVVGTLIGNIPKIAGFMEGVSKMLMTAQNAQNAQMQQQFVQHEQSPRQLSQAVEEMPVITAQETNFMPSADSIRQAMGR